MGVVEWLVVPATLHVLVHVYYAYVMYYLLSMYAPMLTSKHLHLHGMHNMGFLGVKICAS